MVFFFSFLNNLSNRFVNFEIEVVRLNRQSYFGSSNVIAVFHNLLLQFYFLSLFLLLRKRLENVHIYIYIYPNFHFSFTSLFPYSICFEYTCLIYFQTRRARVARTRACVTQSQPGWLPAGIHEAGHYG